MNTVRITCALLMICGLSACANFVGTPSRVRLSDDFSYYEPFENSTQIGPDYLIGPPPPDDVEVHHWSDSRRTKPLPSIPDRSLPRSCLSCN